VDPEILAEFGPKKLAWVRGSGVVRSGFLVNIVGWCRTSEPLVSVLGTTERRGSGRLTLSQGCHTG